MDTLEAGISAERQRRADTLEFVGVIAAYKDISGLTRAMLNELVERIEVYTVTEAKQGVPRVSSTYKQNICIENSLNQRQEAAVRSRYSPPAFKRVQQKLVSEEKRVFALCGNRNNIHAEPELFKVNVEVNM